MFLNICVSLLAELWCYQEHCCFNCRRTWISSSCPSEIHTWQGLTQENILHMSRFTHVYIHMSRFCVFGIEKGPLCDKFWFDFPLIYLDCSRLCLVTLWVYVSVCLCIALLSLPCLPVTLSWCPSVCHFFCSCLCLCFWQSVCLRSSWFIFLILDFLVLQHLYLKMKDFAVSPAFRSLSYPWMMTSGLWMDFTELDLIRI